MIQISLVAGWFGARELRQLLHNLLQKRTFSVYYVNLRKGIFRNFVFLTLLMLFDVGKKTFSSHFLWSVSILRSRLNSCPSTSLNKGLEFCAQLRCYLDFYPRPPEPCLWDVTAYFQLLSTKSLQIFINCATDFCTQSSSTDCRFCFLSVGFHTFLHRFSPRSSLKLCEKRERFWRTASSERSQ